MIFISRTNAIWGNDKRIGIFLFALGILIILCCVIILKLSFLGPVSDSDDIRLFDGCLDFNFHQLFWVCYLLLLVLESAILFFNVLKILQNIKYNVKYNMSFLLWTIFRDGILFYMCICATSIINIVFLNMLDRFLYLSLVPVFFHQNLYAILSIRLTFNIRGAGDRGRTEQLEEDMMSVRDLQANVAGEVSAQSVVQTFCNYRGLSRSTLVSGTNAAS